MVINNVKEKYKSLQDLGFCENISSFVLCYYQNKEQEIDIVPVNNKIKDATISSKDMMITDKYGNLLIDFKKLNYDNILINYVNDNDLIISNYSLIKPQFIFKRIYNSINHYVYDENENKLILKEQIYQSHNNKLLSFEMINDDIDNYLIETLENFEKKARIYSVSEKKYITPEFNNLEIVENTNQKLLKYTDKIKSSLIINDISYSSNIIGFITVNGKFYNGVYDELLNKEIEYELNSKPNFEEYNELKKMIQDKLNEKVVKESNKKTTKDFIIKKLENKAKRNF